LTLGEALHAYTTGPAYAAGMEDRLGRLAPGCLADLIVLPRDPFSLAPDALAELRPEAVMVGGAWVLEG
jgi:predicted amidohydrolase YtcJ